MNANEKTELFKNLDKVIAEYYGRLRGAEFFKLVSEYQISRLNQIEEFEITRQEQALYRTAMYNTELLEAYKKTTSDKKKEKLVFKLVNLLCIANSSLLAVERGCDHDREIFNIAIAYKEKIIGSKDWYLRVIPESKWLIEYLENM